jgi:hypothetical protein
VFRVLFPVLSTTPSSLLLYSYPPTIAIVHYQLAIVVCTVGQSGDPRLPRVVPAVRVMVSYHDDIYIYIGQHTQTQTQRERGGVFRVLLPLLCTILSPHFSFIHTHPRPTHPPTSRTCVSIHPRQSKRRSSTREALRVPVMVGQIGYE